jgi:nucleotide-binding universal stress UspA family protein
MEKAMKVLFATDGSEFAQAALESLASRPWADDTSFLVLNVVQAIEPSYMGFNYGYTDAILLVDESSKKAAKKLVDETVAEMKAKLPGKDIKGMVVQGYIVDHVVEVAKEWDADMIVVGSHGRTGLAKFFIGSVAEAVLNRAPCSVEVIRKLKVDQGKTKQKAKAAAAS